MPFPELGDLADDVRRLFAELDLKQLQGARTVAGECTPELDVFETDGAFEIVVDLPGVDRAAIRILIKADTVVIAGQKTAPESPHLGNATFHRVERAFGRFARVVRLSGAFDAAAATARFRQGELTIRIPKIADRRSREIPVSVD